MISYRIVTIGPTGEKLKSYIGASALFFISNYRRYATLRNQLPSIEQAFIRHKGYCSESKALASIRFQHGIKVMHFTSAAGSGSPTYDHLYATTIIKRTIKQ